MSAAGAFDFSVVRAVCPRWQNASPQGKTGMSALSARWHLEVGAIGFVVLDIRDLSAAFACWKSALSAASPPKSVIFKVFQNSSALLRGIFEVN